MLGLFKILLVYVWSSFQSRERLKAEIIVLRHQLNILSRKVPKRPGLSGGDRAILAVSSFSADCGCHHRCAAGIDRWLASSGLESLVALEVSQSWRSTEDRSRATRSDPPDVSREPFLGRSSHSWGAAQAWAYDRCGALSVPFIRFLRIDDVVRQGCYVNEWLQSVRSDDERARPWPVTDVCVRYCNSGHTQKAHAANVPH